MTFNAYISINKSIKIEHRVNSIALFLSSTLFIFSYIFIIYQWVYLFIYLMSIRKISPCMFRHDFFFFLEKEKKGRGDEPSVNGP